MISDKARANAAGLFEELIEAWGRAKKAVAPDLRPKAAILRDNPELAPSGRVLRGLSRLGYDLDVNDFVATYRDGETNDFVATYRDGETKQVFHERSEDVPAVLPGHYSGFVPVTYELFQTLEAVLRMLWNRATGHLKSQPRFIPPAARTSLEIEPVVAEQKARLRSYTQPKPKKQKAPTRPPRCVVVCEQEKFTAKFAGLSPSGRPKVRSIEVARTKLVGNVKAIMDFIESECFQLYGTRYRFTKYIDITKVRHVFLSLPPLVVTYDDLYQLSRSKTGKRVKKEQALAELSASGKLTPTMMATIRKQVARFNQFWRNETDDPGTWLVPDPAFNGKSGGAWKLQVMLFLPPDRDDV